MIKLVALVACVALTAQATPLRARPSSLSAANSDQITSLPGVDWIVSFNQYSGYLDLPGTEKHMFYWFVEAKTNPESAPVVFWTNGGPGCSGLIGFMTEHGPFRPLENNTLDSFEYSWNTLVNMVYIEQPVGVGFSYSDNEDDYKIGDSQSAKDNWALIQQFFARYPELAQNDMYLTSESYGGHYMPTLAKEIVLNNNGTIKFKGFAVGNPLTNMVENAHGMYDTFYGHQVVSRPSYEKWAAKCSNGESTNECEELANQLLSEAGNLDPYALDYPVCNDDQLRAGRQERYWLAHYLHANKNAGTRLKLGLKMTPSDYQPCANDWAANYLNRDDVKEAIHAKSSITWAMCSSVTQYNQTDVSVDMVPIYNFLLSGDYGLHILVYSGDDDTVCGTLGTQTWIWDLEGQSVTHPWKAWVYDDVEYGNQIGGYLVKFNGISFATVHGAGHTVPTFRPQRALHLFSKYLSGEF